MLYPATFSVLPSQACSSIADSSSHLPFPRFSLLLEPEVSLLSLGRFHPLDGCHFLCHFLSFPFSLAFLCFTLFFLAVEAIRFTVPCITRVAFVLLCCNFGVSVDLPWTCYLSSLSWGHSHGHLRNPWAAFSAGPGKACLRLRPPHSLPSRTHLSVPASVHFSKTWPTSSLYPHV